MVLALVADHSRRIGAIAACSALKLKTHAARKSRVSSPPLQRAVSITAPHSAASIGMRSEPIRHLYQSDTVVRSGWVGHWVASGLKGLLEHIP